MSTLCQVANTHTGMAPITLQFLLDQLTECLGGQSDHSLRVRECRYTAGVADAEGHYRTFRLLYQGLKQNIEPILLSIRL